ncbi:MULTISPECIES: hypothetical protein [unclassified Snodgrassella]|uniref:hypothetical protein n=1 Tax=unclassified Snodgrassella TaxID=2625236 RepID=UPI0018DB6123|nr:MULTISPECIES: hypothetical protein [Snodgrassella]MBI0067497.1 hypothetical protein [Snodgrassella sp. M0110]MBI0076539.1 hypothetical protein [Snodgrassella sp. M0118]MBI0078797.1 hypothetical protein [Snodgrassella sp. M0112]
MIKDRKFAKEVTDLMLNITSELNESLIKAQNCCSAEEFNEYRRAVGVMLGKMYFDVLVPLFTKHPEIKPEELN